MVVVNIGRNYSKITAHCHRSTQKYQINSPKFRTLERIHDTQQMVIYGDHRANKTKRDEQSGPSKHMNTVC